MIFITCVKIFYASVHLCIVPLPSRLVISTRDLMSWILFFNRTVAERTLSPAQAFYHGACLVFMDSLQTDSKLHAAFQQAMMEELKSILLRWDQDLEEPPVDPTRPVKENKMETEKQDLFGIHPFYLPFGELNAVLILYRRLQNLCDTTRTSNHVQRTKGAWQSDYICGEISLVNVTCFSLQYMLHSALFSCVANIPQSPVCIVMLILVPMKEGLTVDYSAVPTKPLFVALNA